MNLSLALGIVGLMATLLGIYIAVKYSIFLGKITFVKEQIIPLFYTIVKNLPDLSVSYKGNPISPNLFLIKGAILNSGKKDISPTMIEKPITITLPEEYKWIEAKVISNSENVKANMVITNQIFFH